jgi:hypothetical protein
MKKIQIIMLVFLVGILALVSCKKKEAHIIPPVAKSTSNIAPCSLYCTSYASYSVDSSGNVNFPQAKYIVKFVNTSGANSFGSAEFAFNKIPESGMYYMVTAIDTMDQLKLNQMATYADSGSFAKRSAPTSLPVIYIENNQNEFIISYCSISNNSFIFDPYLNCWVGNSPTSLRIQFKK